MEKGKAYWTWYIWKCLCCQQPVYNKFFLSFMLVSSAAANTKFGLSFHNRETGALCAMKEVEMFPDDPKSAECIKQLEQVIF